MLVFWDHLADGLAFLSLVGSLILVGRSLERRRPIHAVFWALLAAGAAWLTIGEVLWRFCGLDTLATRVPRAVVFRLLLTAAIWWEVFTTQRRRTP